MASNRWRTLVLLYPVLDARYGSGLSKRRAQRVMTREERETIEEFLPRIPRAVEAWSDGLATQDPFDLVVVRRPLKSLSSSGGGRWWVGPREVSPELTEVAATGAAYDSVYAMWPAEPSIEQCGWGCSLGPSDATFGAGFSSISTDSGARWPLTPTPSKATSTNGSTRSKQCSGGSGWAMPSCRRSTMRHSSRRRARPMSPRSAARLPTITMGSTGGPLPGRGRRGIATG